jgi:hypothetical protein
MVWSQLGPIGFPHICPGSAIYKAPLFSTLDDPTLKLCDCTQYLVYATFRPLLHVFSYQEMDLHPKLLYSSSGLESSFDYLCFLVSYSGFTHEQ